MAHFAYTRAGGVWNALTVLTSAEMADLDAKTFAAINGDAGGTWAPSDPIIIGGDGLDATGPLASSGGATFTAGAFRISGGSCRVDVLGDFRLGLSVQGAGVTLEATAPLDSKGTTRLRGTVTCDANITAGTTIFATGNISSVAAITAGTTLICGGALTVGAGAGITGAVVVTGSISCTTTLHATGNGDVDGNFDVAGTSSLHGGVSCYAGLDVANAVLLSSTLHVLGAVDFDSTLNVDGTLHADGAATFDDTLQVDGATTLTGGVNILAPSTLTGVLISSSTGRVRVRRIDGSTSNATYGINDADEIQAPSGLAGNIAYTLSTTGAGEGDRIRFVANDTTYTVTISGGGEAGYAIKHATGFFKAIEYSFNGAAWQRSMGYPFDA